ncbi:hypothetical protein BDK51DRAFT_28297 [Blyttiomyces helicus]|uniref:Uncharacterized protein n=1 Tax=Blyttiomyces helicus TaxID=388810 RepID=A0A4P9WBK9_9FUNG|nr:hypothetical protein BDK51DRAFT_28297 [Blyttiomyces helicus]|eukprot:RKO89874.1 hypothetical protein BDK51DRAFT_28297 [Blyttiomyces helicus]
MSMHDHCLQIPLGMGEEGGKLSPIPRHSCTQPRPNGTLLTGALKFNPVAKPRPHLAPMPIPATSPSPPPPLLPTSRLALSPPTTSNNMPRIPLLPQPAAPANRPTPVARMPHLPTVTRTAHFPPTPQLPQSTPAATADHADAPPTRAAPPMPVLTPRHRAPPDPAPHRATIQSTTLFQYHTNPIHITHSARRCCRGVAVQLRSDAEDEEGSRAVVRIEPGPQTGMLYRRFQGVHMALPRVPGTIVANVLQPTQERVFSLGSQLFHGGGDVRAGTDARLIYSVHRKKATNVHTLYLHDSKGRPVWKISQRQGRGHNYDVFGPGRPSGCGSAGWKLHGTVDRASSAGVCPRLELRCEGAIVLMLGDILHESFRFQDPHTHHTLGVFRRTPLTPPTTPSTPPQTPPSPTLPTRWDLRIDMGPPVRGAGTRYARLPTALAPEMLLAGAIVVQHCMRTERAEARRAGRGARWAKAEWEARGVRSHEGRVGRGEVERFGGRAAAMMMVA